MNKQKFWVLNIIAVFVLAGLAFAGFLTESFTGAGKYGSIGVAVLAFLALVLAYRGKLMRADWIIIRLTAFGLVGTLIGVAQAFAHAQFTAGDPLAALASISSHIGLALLSTLSGVVAWLWTDYVVDECLPLDVRLMRRKAVQ